MRVDPCAADGRVAIQFQPCDLIRMVGDSYRDHRPRVRMPITIFAPEEGVRGSLMGDASVPVGFQRMACDLRLQVSAGTEGERIKRLMASAERFCIVYRIRACGISVATDWYIDQDVDTELTA